jgi:hypothetical protein
VVAGAFGPDSLLIGADHWRQALQNHWRPKALNSNGSLSSVSAGRGLSKHAGLALDSVDGDQADSPQPWLGALCTREPLR